jgi:hypothetical protein
MLIRSIRWGQISIFSLLLDLARLPNGRDEKIEI